MEAVEETQSNFKPTKDEIEIDTSEAQETEVELGKEASEGVEGVEVEDPNEQEQQVSSAQKRINQLTKKMRDAEKREKEAIRYAQQVQTQAKQLEKQVQSLDQGYMQQYGKSLEIELAQAKGALKHAIDIGDSDAIVAAQEDLSKLGARNVQYEQAQQRNEERAPEPQAAQTPQAAPAPQAQATPEIRRPDPKAEGWARKNDWFGQDEVMTFAAFGIHKKLIEEEGFDPETDEYYTELDRRLVSEFPKKLGSSKRPAQTVAGVSRQTSGRSKRVKLTPTQVAIAKKLGVPLEEYAKYVKE